MKENKMGIWSAISVLWKIGNNKDKFSFIGLLFLGIIRAVSELLVPLITACIIAKLSGERAEILGIAFPDEMSTVAVAISCLVILFIVYIMCTSIRALIRLFASNMKAKTNVYALEQMLQYRKNCDIGMSNGEASYIIKNSSEHVANFIEVGLVKIFCPVLSAVLSIVYISVVSIISLPVLIVAILLLSCTVLYRTHYDGKIYKNLEEINGDINNHVLNNIENFSFISYVKAKANEIKVSKEMNKKFYKTDKKRIVTYIVYWGLTYIIECACAVSVVFLIINNSPQSIHMASTLIIVIPYLLKIFTQTENLGAMIGDCQRYGISISRVEIIKVSPDKLITMSMPKVTENLISVEKLSENIVIEKLEVKDMKVRVGSFEKVYNVTFEKGKINCIMGQSGGGKTTLINLLLGLVGNEEGCIIVNDKYKLNNLFFENKRVSISFQGENFFDRSIKENVSYPNAEFGEKELTLIKEFGLDELLVRENENVDNFKNQLSGGEKKRLSFIRCLSKDAEVYILDEPTNELDEKNVKKAIKELKHLKKHAVVIVISHDKRVMEVSENIIVI